tara:strand:+ start:11026 stop:11601 length:576 start_codon:yes stop_codon:yes gene_type:complete
MAKTENAMFHKHLSTDDVLLEYKDQLIQTVHLHNIEVIVSIIRNIPYDKRKEIINDKLLFAYEFMKKHGKETKFMKFIRTNHDEIYEMAKKKGLSADANILSFAANVWKKLTKEEKEKYVPTKTKNGSLKTNNIKNDDCVIEADTAEVVVVNEDRKDIYDYENDGDDDEGDDDDDDDDEKEAVSDIDTDEN